MLDQQRVVKALEAERASFARFSAEQEQQQRMAARWEEIFSTYSSAELCARVAGIPWPGALPTRELDEAGKLLIPFRPGWQHHPDARGWAMGVLAGKPAIAVDGSQIAPDPIYSIPVGAIQIGWFVNPHDGAQPYVKEIEFTVLPPEELSETDGEMESFAIQAVNQRRFVRECERLADLMLEYARPEADVQPLSFFDGSFIISFAGKIQSGRARPYIRAIDHLLTVSRIHEAPLVGFVDTSNSRDIANLVYNLGINASGLPDVSDAALLRSILPRWGDRTPFFICARPDALSKEEPGIFYKDVAFCYIRLARNRPPARLEIPLWLLESGQAESMVDRVRAECVVGGGYPYAIETADAVAVLSHQDRRRFYAIFDHFLNQEGLALDVSRKALSKQGRRTP